MGVCDYVFSKKILENYKKQRDEFLNIIQYMDIKQEKYGQTKF